jgi:hypothetical protein
MIQGLILNKGKIFSQKQPQQFLAPFSFLFNVLVVLSPWEQSDQDVKLTTYSVWCQG